MIAAAPPPAAVLEAMARNNFEITHVYGLTETYGPAVICEWHDEWDELPLDERARLNARQGVRYHMLETLMVADPQTLEPVPPDGKTLGEVFFRGNIVMMGYLKNPTATEQALRGGWFHSGDLGVLHPDGYIELKDRAKDIIISGGENISTIEVENVLYRHPAVLEAAVVARPDEKWGEVPCAFVTLRSDAPDITEADLIAYCRANMAHFKAPKKIIFGQLPKTSTGKVQKYVLRERARGWRIERGEQDGRLEDRQSSRSTGYTGRGAPGPAQRSGRVTTLTLNRPRQFNALSSAMLAALQEELDKIAADESVRVVVLAAAGKAFCAGHDLKEMRSHPDKAFQNALFEQCSRMMLTINRMPQPVIARVHGLATAAGCQLVAACDLAVAADTAQFATSGIRVGLFCSTPSVAVSRNLSRKKALEILLTGEFIDAHTAEREGLINYAVPPEELDAAVQRLADAIVAKSPVAVATGKGMFYRQLEMGMEDAYSYAAEVMACNMMAEDAHEGIDAFIEKRAPVWKGR